MQTVGYGDLTIEKESSRIFSVFYIILSVVIVAGALGNIGAVQVSIAAEKKRNAMLTRKLGTSTVCDSNVHVLVCFSCIADYFFLGADEVLPPLCFVDLGAIIAMDTDGG